LNSGLFLFTGASAQAVALEFDAMGVVHDAIQYGIGEGGIGNDVVPLRQRSTVRRSTPITWSSSRMRRAVAPCRRIAISTTIAAM